MYDMDGLVSFAVKDPQYTGVVVDVTVVVLKSVHT